MERLDGALASLSTLMTQLSGQIHSSAGDAVDDISAIHGSLSAIQDVIHGTGSDFDADTSHQPTRSTTRSRPSTGP